MRPREQAPAAAGDVVLGALPNMAALRGPRPPELVCPHCQATILEYFEHPVLVELKRQRRYRGEVTGGQAACGQCLQDRAVREATRGQAVAAELAGVPAPLVGASLEYLKRKPGTATARAAAADWLDARADHDLYLFGPTGVGKTGLAVALGLEAVRRGIVRSGVFVRVPTLIAQLRAAIRDDAGGRALSHVERAPLLILDDLGAEHGTNYTRTAIEGLYTARLDAGRPTIITSNLPIALDAQERAAEPGARRYRATLGEFLDDDRLVSRIAGHADIVEVLGVDQRLTGWQARARPRKHDEPIRDGLNGVD